MMRVPGFTAESSLIKSRRTYHGKYLYGNPSLSQNGRPAMVLPGQYEGMEGMADGNEAGMMEDVEAEDTALEDDLENGEEG